MSDLQVSCSTHLCNSLAQSIWRYGTLIRPNTSFKIFVTCFQIRASAESGFVAGVAGGTHYSRQVKKHRRLRRKNFLLSLFFFSRTVRDFSVKRPCFLFIRCLPVLPACLAACLCSGRQAGRRQTGRTLVRTSLSRRLISLWLNRHQDQVGQKEGLRQTLLLFCFALTGRSGPNILIPLDDRALTQRLWHPTQAMNGASGGNKRCGCTIFSTIMPVNAVTRSLPSRETDT